MAEKAGNKLKKYLEENNMTYLEFSRKLGVTRSTIWYICENNRKTKNTVALKIEAYTGGLIAARELCPNLD